MKKKEREQYTHPELIFPGLNEYGLFSDAHPVHGEGQVQLGRDFCNASKYRPQYGFVQVYFITLLTAKYPGLPIYKYRCLYTSGLVEFLRQNAGLGRFFNFFLLVF